MNKKTEKNLLRDAFVDAMLREVDRDLEKCEESPICSPEHYKRMSEIVGFDVTKPRRKSKISTRTKIAIAIIAAAIVALTSCVAAIYHRQIGNFIEEFYEKYIKVHSADETTTAPTEIEDIYTLTYVPDGYELVDSEITTAWTKFEYTNSLNETIVFEQYVLIDTCNVLDSENGYTKIYESENLNIYYKEFNGEHIYKWNNGIYSFSLCDRKHLSFSAILKTINGLQKQ